MSDRDRSVVLASSILCVQWLLSPNEWSIQGASMETESVFMNMGIVLACEKNVDVLYNTEFEMYFNI